MCNFFQHYILVVAVAARLLLMPLLHVGFHHLVHHTTHRLTHLHKLFKFTPDVVMIASLAIYDAITENHSTES